MVWWGWLLLAWVVIAVVVGMGLGMVVRAAEGRELGHDRARVFPPDVFRGDGRPPDESPPGRSPPDEPPGVSGPLGSG
ncbi:hypothetical protein JOD57_002821 [Geodermatophilus bullaregiensis]|nr:hypothetical protein [Geodermatophilus bullaregiensis]